MYTGSRAYAHLPLVQLLIVAFAHVPSPMISVLLGRNALLHSEGLRHYELLVLKVAKI
jgi:hypothetical protein